MKYDVTRSEDKFNTIPMYCAVWSKGDKETGSGYIKDQAEAEAIAQRHNGYVMCGYFAGSL